MMHPRPRTTQLAFSVMLLVAPVAAAEEADDASAEASSAAATWTLLPGETFYPSYDANPRRPQNSVGQMVVWDSELVDQLDSGRTRLELRLGERFTVFRREGADGRLLDIYLEGGFFGQFDNRHQQDSVGWDGWIGAHAAYRLAEAWMTKVAFRHLSAHTGDELIVRTGIDRFGYTREDVSLALAWNGPDRLQAYIEGGATVNQGKPSQQELLDVRFGIQRRQEEPHLWGFGTVWGADVHLFQEDDWYPNLTATAALLRPSAATSGVLRFGLELHLGHAVLGEFRRVDESYLMLVVGYEH
jgi:hypothetical protein